MTKLKISIIACLARNGAIGYNNKLLYHIPEDMRRFKQLTTGHTIVMGRNTYLSLPHGALPHRRNIVVSSTFLHASTLAATLDSTSPFITNGSSINKSLEDGSMVCPSLTSALDLCRQMQEEEIFVIGGSKLYQEALTWADCLYLTIVDDTPQQADAYFPYDQEQVLNLAQQGWVVENKPNLHTGDITYHFLTLRRKHKKNTPPSAKDV